MSLAAAARLRRTYLDCRYGQLHVHQAIPPGGGFDEATALLCVPGAAGLGRFFQALLAPLGTDRSIYAPDLPGCGESDHAIDAANAVDRAGTIDAVSAGKDALASAMQYALAMGDMLDSLCQRRVDVLCHAEGLATALALVALRKGGSVRRLVYSAPSPELRAQAQQLELPVHEVALAPANAARVSAASATQQLNDLIKYFGN